MWIASKSFAQPTVHTLSLLMLLLVLQSLVYCLRIGQAKLVGFLQQLDEYNDSHEYELVIFNMLEINVDSIHVDSIFRLQTVD